MTEAKTKEKQKEKKPKKKAAKGPNPMTQIQVAKLTLNIGAGTDQKEMERGMKLLKHITGTDPIKTFTEKRIPDWGLRPGLPIGCMITLRGKKALGLIPNLLEARDRTLPKSCFDNHGNISFGIKEYIDIEGVKYNPDIGMMGLQVSITLERPGFRVKRRKSRTGNIPRRHQITQDQAIEYLEKEFKVKS